MKTNVTDDQINASIAAQYSFTGSEAIGGDHGHAALDRLCICLIVLQSGHIIVGKSMPSSPIMFDPEHGAKLAYDDAVNQIKSAMADVTAQEIEGDDSGGGGTGAPPPH